MTVSKRVIYTGRVQGVGFRYTAQQLAREFTVAGTVRNRPDGAVELVVQGPPGQVDGFLASVAREMRGYIDGQEVQDAAPTTITGFHIIR
jgi:acylphosphatase